VKVKRSSITRVIIISSATDSARVERGTLHKMRRASGGRVIREAEGFIYTGGETTRERNYEASGGPMLLIWCMCASPRPVSSGRVPGQ